MAKKSKTQRAKASAVRQAKKEARETEDSQELSVEQVQEDNKSKSLLKKSKDADKKPAKADNSDSKKEMKKSEEKKPSKKRFQFFRDVKAELKRVTWPTRSDVMRWTGVVAVALVFFGIFVAVLDNLVITPLLVLVSGADPSTIDWMSVFTGGDNFDASSSAGTDASSADASSADVSGTDASDAGASDASADVSEDGQSDVVDAAAEESND